MTAPGSLIKRARTEAGLTQRGLAERLGVSQPVVARLESPRANPRIETLRRALRAAGQDFELDLRPAADSVDETLIAGNIRLDPADRLRSFASAYRSTAQLARKARTGDGS